MGAEGDVEYEVERTTVWSFPDRGAWASHVGDYRGNWSPHVPRNLILRYTREGETVLDPMCGSGTSLTEARLLKRNAIGIDISPKAVELARTRLSGVALTADTRQDARTGDARSMPEIGSDSIDLVALHPP